MMRRALLVGLGLLSICLPLRADSATYHVTTSGNDSNSCSAATSVGTAKRNPANGADCLSPGDTLFIHAGTYSVGSWGGPPSGNSSARVTVVGEGVRQTILNLSGDSNGMTLGSSKAWITFDNLVFDCSGVTLGACIKFTGGTNIQFKNGEVHNTGRGPDGTAGGAQGFLLVTGSSNNLISHMLIHHNGLSSLEHGIYSASPDNIYEYNDIHHNGGFGIHNYNGNSDHGNERNISRGNLLHDNAVGLLMADGDDQKGYNNVIYLNSAWAMQSYGSHGSLLLNNTIYDNGESAFNVNSDILICNNIATENGNNSVPGNNAGNSNNQTGSQSFVNAGAANFRLNSGSAAINQGTSGCSVSTYVTTDADGNTRPVNGVWDVGAYEFGGTGPPVCPTGCTCTITPGVCDVPIEVSQDPLAWWKFDEGTGTTASDFTTHGHTGTLVGGPVWTTGRIGPFALQFDGVNDVVTIPDAVLTSWSADQSMCLWAQVVNPLLIGTGNLKQTLLNLSQDSANGVRLAVNEVSTPNGQWWVTILAGGTKIAAGTTAAAFTSNTWVHLCYTLTSTVLKLYVNSVQAETLSNDSFDPAVANVLGGRDATTGNLGGKLDNVKIWNRALSAAEILTDFGGAVGRVSHRGVFK
jgi:Concanavalin A-like lectin/glucanases superfamily/Right handed beta helix region